MDERDASIKFSEEGKESNSDYIIEFREASFSWPESMSNKRENSTEQNGHLVIKNGTYKGRKVTNLLQKLRGIFYTWEKCHSCMHLKSCAKIYFGHFVHCTLHDTF